MVCVGDGACIWHHVRLTQVSQMVKKHGPVLDPDPAKSMILFFLKCEYPAWFLHKKHGKIHHAIKNGKPSISIRAIYTMAIEKEYPLVN